MLKKHEVQTYGRRENKFLVISVVVYRTTQCVNVVCRFIINKLVLVDHVIASDDVIVNDVTGCITLVNCQQQQQLMLSDL